VSYLPPVVYPLGILRVEEVVYWYHPCPLSRQWSQVPVAAVPPNSGSKHVLMAPGLPCLPQKMIDRIVAGKYIDFNDLPPAKGLSKAIPPYLEGQVIVVQAEELMTSWKMIPNFKTWLQCFALFAAVTPIETFSISTCILFIPKATWHSIQLLPE